MEEKKFPFNKEFITKSAIIVILWSTPPLVSKLWVGSGVFPGFYFGFLRYGLGSLFLFLLISFKSKRLKIIPEFIKNNVKPIIICALWLVLMIFGQNFSVIYILGSSSSILLNFNPTLIYLIAPLIFVDEKYSRKRNIGFLIASIGITIVFFASLEIGTPLLSPTSILGYILGIVSGIAWAGYSISIKYFFDDRSPQEVTALNLSFAAIILLLISLMIEKRPKLEEYSFLSLWGIIVIGIGAAAIAFSLYLSLIQSYGATTAGNIQFLIPLVSLVLAWIFLNEFSIFALFGGIFCAAGVGLVTYTKNELKEDQMKNIKSKTSK